MSELSKTDLAADLRRRARDLYASSDNTDSAERIIRLREEGDALMVRAERLDPLPGSGEE
jgi:hypothetical protein